MKGVSETVWKPELNQLIKFHDPRSMIENKQKTTPKQTALIRLGYILDIILLIQGAGNIIVWHSNILKYVTRFRTWSFKGSQ